MGEPEPATHIAVVPYDPAWPGQYDQLRQLIRQSVGDHALSVTHVGSTAVPGLAANPIIDIDLTVADSHDETTYVPQLSTAGFVLRIREPWRLGHRLLNHPTMAVNLHVWSEGSPEAARHLIFRDHLRQNAADRELYAEAKRLAADAHDHQTVMDYNAAKEETPSDRSTAALSVVRG